MPFVKSLLILCFIFFGVSVQAQSKKVRQIMQVFREEEAAWNSGDIDAYMKFYAPHDSVRMIYSKGVVYGRDSIRAFYKKYWPKERMGQLTLDQTTVERLSPRYYFVTGRFTVAFQNGKKATGRFSGLMKKIKGKWYLYTDHSG